VLLTRAYHERRGEQRHQVLTPDTSHGHQPATVTMAGYDVVKVGTNADGGRGPRGPQGPRRPTTSPA
jgi:glycine dehydrogenase subunit 2